MSARLEIEVAPAAQRELRKISDRQALARIAKAIDGLALDPRPHGAEKLKDAPDLWRIRTGDFRIVYAISDGRLVIILAVRDRKDAYRDLDVLKERLRRAYPTALAAEIRRRRT